MRKTDKKQKIKTKMKNVIRCWSGALNNRPGTKIFLNVALIITLSWLSIFVFNPKASSFSLDVADAKELIILTNQERLKYNLSPLFPNDQLAAAALNKANDLLKEQYFSHNSPKGKTFSAWIKDVDYDYIIVGENLAMGFGSKEGIMAAWMNSDKHRQNILNEHYKEIGLAVLRGNYQGRETKMVVQIFGATTGNRLSEIFLPYQELNLRNVIKKLNSYS
ncbi:TPA: hypothetical protein DCL28_00975 [Candidatus Komeilibacteria bacterium]|nr:MAG: hypothetical protein A2260_04590 [Candidatus Komeilibacteria bacterium RIFOXYA2_FULL_45_9]HAH04117.1 hypothetical protein [Candidatus Komeilibacteria bacterium]HBV02075.1 hypothetical protein [Candidatus Komeilibacteria bacterium]HCC73437.1 hypothetical protein [Candidatus Komeilibacteria bacterium]